METFQYAVETPKFTDAEKITEHRPISVLFASLDPIVRVRILTKAKIEDNISFVARSDVAEKQKHLPYKHYVSFMSRGTVRELLDGQETNEVIVQVFHSDSVYDLIKVPIQKYAYRELKEKKLARFAPLLACPHCKKTVRPEKTGFVCDSCAKTFGFNGNAVDFLTSELRAEFSVTDTENVSDFALDAQIVTLAEANPDKLFIDVGAGCKYQCYQNVVNFEIVDYPSTDVLGVGERLPFLDNSFDGVISTVVLEHVKDPFSCAGEMTRILKPGGDLFCTAPFLQPMHGYPHHYYNMTSEGLVNLFSGMKIVTLDVPNHLDPMTALVLILSRYVNGIPAALHAQFGTMTVRDLLATFADNKNKDHPIITQLDGHTRFGIACGMVLHAVK